MCYCYPGVQDAERQVSFTWIRPIVCLIYDHGLAWFSRKVNTVCTFVNQVLQCSGLVYIGVHFPTPNKRHVLMSAQIKHGRRMARLKTWKIIILSNITNLEINLQIFVCISLRAIAILRKDCFWYYWLVNLLRHQQIYWFDSIFIVLFNILQGINLSVVQPCTYYYLIYLVWFHGKHNIMVLYIPVHADLSEY